MSYHKNTQLEISEKERENPGCGFFEISEELFRVVASSRFTRYACQNNYTKLEPHHLPILLSAQRSKN